MNPRAPVSQLLDFSGQAVVVTGASRGIGQGIALRFAEAGADLIVGYHSRDAEAEATVALIRALGGRAEAVRADVATRDGAEQVVEAALQHFGGVDVLINNAGVYPMHGLLDMSDEEWRTVLDANLTSVFVMTQLVARAMIEAGRTGSIVNLSSIEGHAPAPAHSHYASAKAAVNMHTRSAALELGPKGIRVNAVAPGLTYYPELPELWAEGVQRYEAAAPLGRLVRRDEIADACLFLASPGASAITGACLTVDAGVSATPLF